MEFDCIVCETPVLTTRNDHGNICLACSNLNPKGVRIKQLEIILKEIAALEIYDYENRLDYQTAVRNKVSLILGGPGV